MSREAYMHPFAPVAGKDATTLILGSFPSVQSRADGFYYGHPQNRFWHLLAAIYNVPLPQSHDEKRDLLVRHHLALWDAAAQVSIKGSSDASIQNVVPVDLRRVLDAAPIQTVLCNGQLAGKLYTRYLFPVSQIPCVILPSTSPANAAWSLERLKAAWEPYLPER